MRTVWVIFNVYQSDAPLDDPSSEVKMQMAVRAQDIVAYQEVSSREQTFLIVKVEDEPSKVLRTDIPFSVVQETMERVSR
jgi:hypothetical protein